MEPTKSEGPLTKMLHSIHRRMAGVSEEEVRRALAENTSTVVDGAPLTLTMSVEQRARTESASTQTASSQG